MANRHGRSSSKDGEAGPEASSQRIDKWLVFARVVKTRSIAQQLVEAKKVRLNKEKIDNPARNVRVGDVLTISYSSRVHVFQVLGFAGRRGSPGDAQALYEDLNAPVVEVDQGSSDRAEADEIVAAPFQDILDVMVRKRKDPVQRDKDRRKARKERAQRKSW
ncbi:RNA-binding S4 [Fulvimarina pelagi HTCC2506]|uniref:RNA-binding S4 n=2 Tax=Fulvimarina pelagi TaxID=217511 RepID=Q0G1N8_9HYPH|nr:S4 domain-containing protein [Fulvimarina pelagi]EAU41043.1 RNA-binding S4 [Fulvimarina pelagi HTCC2506]BAT30941.1 RNA-binding S4 [Fulvimarina pelagi]